VHRAGQVCAHLLPWEPDDLRQPQMLPSLMLCRFSPAVRGALLLTGTACCSMYGHRASKQPPRCQQPPRCSH
jgi:hypothetical protein